MTKDNDRANDSLFEGKDSKFMDVDRMVNDGLGGGNVTRDGGLIEETTTDTMDDAEDSPDNAD